MVEQWKVIEDFPEYQASTLGRIKSLRHGKEKILTSQDSKDEYLRIRLFKDGKGLTKLVSRLIAETFLERIDNKETVDHINKNKSDNRLENLRWADRTEQCVNRNLPRGKTGHINILSHPSGFRVSITRYGQKFTRLCKTLEEAIRERDAFLISYNTVH